MVVLQVLPALVSGGVERGTVEMTEAIVRAGGTALVASAGGPLVGAIERAGGEHVTLKLATRDPLNIWLNAGRLTRLVRHAGVQIIHARSRAPAWSARIAARRTGVAFITTYHGAYSENFPGKRRYNAVMASGDRVIAISQFIAARVLAQHRINPARLRLIPRGVDASVFDPDAVAGARIDRLARQWRLPDGAPVVMLPARLSRWKGQSVVLEAVARLARRDVCAVFVGDGPSREMRRLEAQAQALGLNGRMRMVGRCDDMPAAFMLADVVVHASTAPEAFGRVVIEAQAMGRPVIAADLGGPRETVQNGATGWLVPPGDAGILAEGIAHVLDLPQADRQALGQRARAAVLAHYTTAAMQDATLAVYRELLGVPVGA
jgi:glycosyltransferase involved in cell wall biosynthesis